MDRSSLMVPRAGPDRGKQAKDAADMWNDLVKRAEKAGQKPPPYTFLELIGKGGYGRVYKCKKNETGEVVAVKIVDVDTADLELSLHDRDASLKDFHKEVKVLTQLNAGNAENILFIHDAFDLHSQLWIVSDYCPGGSVTTLMRASPPTHYGLEQKYIIPIARELAKAVKSVHDFGAIHRDIKCGNVYITEDGAIRLGDFGIVRIIGEGSSTDNSNNEESHSDPRSKRMTVVGTPNFMPLEMLEDSFPDEGYGTEVDIWAFGCTVYEMATGHAPMATVRGDYNLAATLAEKGEPRLEDPKYSQELRDFIAFILVNDPKSRPTAQQILDHHFLAGTELAYPTSSVVALIDRYVIWEYKGGVRSSLWMEGGAAAPPSAEDSDLQDEGDEIDWNFSVSDSFDKNFANRVSRMYGLDTESSAESLLSPLRAGDLTVAERIALEHQDRSATRGEQSLMRLFDSEGPYYKLGDSTAGPVFQPTPRVDTESDLPLRRLHQPSEPRESVIDLDVLGSIHAPNLNFDLEDITAKPRPSRYSDDDNGDEEIEYSYSAQSGQESSKRDTMDWTFPSVEVDEKRATMEWTFPTEDTEPEQLTMRPGHHKRNESDQGWNPPMYDPNEATVGPDFSTEVINQGHNPPPRPSSPLRDSIASMIDLDAATFADPVEMRRPSTASSAADSTHTELTSGNPFDLEDEPFPKAPDRFSYHKQWSSEGGSESNRGSLRNIPMHSRSTSLASSASELESMSRSNHFGPALQLGFQPDTHEHTRDENNSALDNDQLLDLNKWPDFGPHDDTIGPSINVPGLYGAAGMQRSDSDFGYNTPGLPGDEGPRSKSQTADIPGWKGTVDFPTLIAPNPEALVEGADPELVASELERLIGDLEIGFSSLVHAFSQKAEEMGGSSDEQDDLQGGESGAEAGEEDETGY